jgi:hypothetical protein
MKTTETNTNDITIPTTPSTVPFNRNGLEADQSYDATVSGYTSQVNHNGKPFVNVKFDVNGKSEYLAMYLNPEARDSTLKNLRRAFGIEKLSQIPEIVGQQCSLRTKIDTYGSTPRVVIAFVNRFNPHANEVVDFDALDADMEANPLKTPEEIAF